MVTSKWPWRSLPTSITHVKVLILPLCTILTKGWDRKLNAPPPSFDNHNPLTRSFVCLRSLVKIPFCHILMSNGARPEKNLAGCFSNQQMCMCLFVWQSWNHLQRRKENQQRAVCCTEVIFDCHKFWLAGDPQNENERANKGEPHYGEGLPPWCTTFSFGHLLSTATEEWQICEWLKICVP